MEFNLIASVMDSHYQESAIILPGPPIQILAQRAAPTIVLTALQQTHGKFYYECKTITGGCMQIGWADCAFTCDIDEGDGVGDDSHSWAYDGSKCLKWHSCEPESFGREWKAGDVICIAIDLDSPRKVSFSLNGDWKKMGTAYENIEPTGGVYPCITLSRGERVELYLGTQKDKFKYSAPSNDYSVLSVTQPLEDEEEENKFSCSTSIIEMDMNEHAFTMSFAGEMLVNMMGLGLSYEAEKNALIHAGYEETISKWSHMKEKLENKEEEMKLSDDEIYALICYTLEEPPVYRYFNNDTRKGFQGDGDDFPILNYLLQKACKKINTAQPESCRTKIVYRGVPLTFAAKIGETIRFGSFTSTSGNENVSDDFQKNNNNGTKFVIKTKLGAPIAMFSAYPEEEEVLIPPYEVFEVKRIEDDGKLTIYVESTAEDEED